MLKNALDKNTLKWDDWAKKLAHGISAGDLTAVGAGSLNRREARLTQLGELWLVDISAPAQKVVHALEQGIANHPANWLITVHDYGQSFVHQETINAELSHGDIVFRRSVIPSTVNSTTAIRQVVLRIPESLVKQSHLSWPNQPLYLPKKSGVVSATAAFILKLADEIDFLPASIRASTADSLMSLLSLAASEQTTSLTSHSTKGADEYFQRACQLIQKRLQDRDLCVAQIADELCISTRYLQKIFAKAKLSASQFIWDQRLVRARLDLLNPDLANKSITDICFKWGFSDSGHFSRAFKKRFAILPKDIRHLPAPDGLSRPGSLRTNCRV